MELKNLVRKNILSLAPYSTARDEYQGELDVYLDANENPFNDGYNRYPDPYQKRLKSRLSEIKGVDVTHIFIGNGSDEPIDLVYRIFCEPGVHNAVAIAPTYGMYRVAADINGVEYREVMLRDDFSLDVSTLLSEVDEHTRLLFLCSPNNPTGNALCRKDLEYLLSHFGGIVVLDEAYIDFSDTPGFLSQLDCYPNLIILQTLSKAWGMAGLRLGLAFASPEIIQLLTRVKYPYNINVVTQKLVMTLLDKDMAGQVKTIRQERERLLSILPELPVIRQVYPSDANFILVRVDEPRKVYLRLIEKGIVVRDRSRIRGCEGCLRLTVGTPEENERLVSELKSMSV